ncbi:MAG: hypothetical protein ABNG96_06805 [Flavobacterium sp.]|jgi:hypothetical protein
MSIEYKYTVCLFLFFSQIISSQINIDNEVVLKQIINNNNLIKYEKINTQVTINQIGFQNFVNVNLVTGSSGYSVYQYGIMNNIELVKPYFTSLNEEYFYQNGNNNFISQKSYYSNNFSNNTIIQTGNNLNFQSFGENSISSRIIFSQTGNSGDILMFNR